MSPTIHNTRKEPIRGLDIDVMFASTWAARGGGVCGKCVWQLVLAHPWQLTLAHPLVS
jgi:hypothetical protein